MEKIRVLHCLEKVDSGGVEQRRLILARQLDGTHYEQALVCTDAEGALPARFAEAGCPLHTVGEFRGVLDREPYRRTLEVVRAFRPHIIHGAVFEGVSLATIIGRLAGVPVIVGEETSDPVNRRWRGHLLLRLLGALSHQMVAVSPAVEHYLLKRLHLPRSKVTLINNGVAAAPPPEAAQVRALRERLGLAPEHFVTGTVGRLHDHHKRVSDLIRALATLLPACPEARLLVVGHGPDEGMLRELAETFGVAERVRFVGNAAGDGGDDYLVGLLRGQGYQLLISKGMKEDHMSLGVDCSDKRKDRPFYVLARESSFINLTRICPDRNLINDPIAVVFLIGEPAHRQNGAVTPKGLYTCHIHTWF